MADNTQEYGTTIGPDARFKGELSFDSAAKIQGTLEGSIAAKGKVFIAHGSTCKASIEAKEVEVEGKIEGNVVATDRIELKPKGIVKGDITAGRMSMADGASIDGHLRIGAAATNGKAGATTTEVKPQAAQTTQPAAAKK